MDIWYHNTNHCKSTLYFEQMSGQEPYPRKIRHNFSVEPRPNRENGLQRRADGSLV